MSANPEPDDIFAFHSSESAVAATDPSRINGVLIVYLLVIEPGMIRIAQETFGKLVLRVISRRSEDYRTYRETAAT